MSATLLTLGYQQRSITEFVSLLKAKQIDVLVDVRATAWSHKPGFSKGPLQAALCVAGVEYVHAQYAGNPKWLRVEAPTHAECLELYAWYLGAHPEIVETFEALLAELRVGHRRICITCFERHAEDCHRSILAESWRQRGSRRVEHIAIDGCERLLKVVSPNVVSE